MHKNKEENNIQTRKTTYIQTRKTTFINKEDIIHKNRKKT